MSERKGFNFLKSYFDVYLMLENDKDKVDFIDNIFNKQFYGTEPTFEGVSLVSKISYIGQKHSLDKSVKGFEDKTGKKLTPLEHTFEANKKPLEDSFEQVQEEVQVQVQGEEKVKEEVKYIVPKTEKVFEENIYDCYNSCLKYFENHLQPKNDKIKISWLNTIENLNRIEKIPLEKIIEITKSVREDKFWSGKFLALTKLRTKNKDGILYIVVFNENFKPKPKTINRQTQEVIESNLKGW